MTDRDFEGQLELFEQTGNPRYLFKRLEVVGNGSFGKVFKSLNVITREIVAVKCVKFEELPTDESFEDLKSEIRVMSICSCNYIIKYLRSYIAGDELWISMEYLGGGSLSDLLRPGRFPDPHIRVVLRDVTRGICYLHENGIIHRDVKARNIIVSEYGEIKLTDFGVAAKLNNYFDQRNTACGTPLYMAPEVILENHYSFEVDVWSLGILAYELSMGFAPNSHMSPANVMASTLYYDPPKLEGDFEPDIKEFVAVCLRKDPQERPTAVDLLSHPCIDVDYSPEILIELIDEMQQWKAANLASRNMLSGLDSFEQPEYEYEDEEPFWDFDLPARYSPQPPLKLSSRKSITPLIRDTSATAGKK